MNRETRVGSALERVRAASKKIEEGEHAEALEILRTVHETNLGTGASGYVSYAMAICCDCLEDRIMAFRYVEEALAQDPLSVPFNDSFGIIVHGIRKALAAPALDPAAASTPKLYDILLRSGEADTASHLAMVRHLMHARDLDGALHILQAVTVLDPTSQKAWGLTAELARTLGNAELESRAQGELAELSKERNVVFGIPAASARN